MARIRDIFSSGEYDPFVSICERRGYEEMSDLAQFPFRELRGEADFPPRMLSKITTIVVTYSRAHAEEFAAGKKPARKPVPAAAAAEMERKLEAYFQDHADRLVKIADLSKFLGKKVRRADLLGILERAPWCKVVDATTFFYSP